MTRVPTLGSMPTESTTISIVTSIGRDIVGGSGTLNDNVFSTTSDNNQLLLTTMNAVDGLPIEPVITLHLRDEAVGEHVENA